MSYLLAAAAATAAAVPAAPVPAASVTVPVAPGEVISAADVAA